MELSLRCDSGVGPLSLIGPVILFGWFAALPDRSRAGAYTCRVLHRYLPRGNATLTTHPGFWRGIPHYHLPLRYSQIPIRRSDVTPAMKPVYARVLLFLPAHNCRRAGGEAADGHVWCCHHTNGSAHFVRPNGDLHRVNQAYRS